MNEGNRTYIKFGKCWKRLKMLLKWKTLKFYLAVIRLFDIQPFYQNGLLGYNCFIKVF